MRLANFLHRIVKLLNQNMDIVQIHRWKSDYFDKVSLFYAILSYRNIFKFKFTSYVKSKYLVFCKFQIFLFFIVQISTFLNFQFPPGWTNVRLPLWWERSFTLLCCKRTSSTLSGMSWLSLSSSLSLLLFWAYTPWSYLSFPMIWHDWHHLIVISLHYRLLPCPPGVVHR